MGRAITIKCQTAKGFLAALSFRGNVKRRVGGEWWRAPWQRADATARDWVFRGLADATYDLIPSGLRPHYTGTWMPDSPDGRAIDGWCRLRDDAASPRALKDSASGKLWTHQWQARAEGALAWRFMRMTDVQGLPLPAAADALEGALRTLATPGIGPIQQWPPSTALPLIALAQHYSVPSRLLDWSRKPLIASYFAASGCAAKVDAARTQKARPKQLAVWALNRRAIDDGQVDGVEMVSAPRANNPNLHLQSGLFTLIRPRISAPTDLVDRAAFDLDAVCQQAPPDDVLVKVTLPAAHAPALLARLRDEFIQATTVYAGFPGAAQSVLEHRLRR